MNHQSDYGYTIGGIEHRTAATCTAQIRTCRRLARQYAASNPDLAQRLRGFAKGWLAEAKIYRAAERRHALAQ